MPRYTQEQFDVVVKKRSKGRIIRLDTLDRSRSIRFKCKKHNKSFLYHPTKLLHTLKFRGPNSALQCPDCTLESNARRIPYGRYKHDRNWYINELSRLKSVAILVDTNWGGFGKKLLHKCPLHNIEYLCSIKTVLSAAKNGYKGAGGCRMCRTESLIEGRGQKVTNVFDYQNETAFDAILKEKSNGRFKRTGPYFANKEILISCVEHGESFSILPSDCLAKLGWSGTSRPLYCKSCKVETCFDYTNTKMYDKYLRKYSNGLVKRIGKLGRNGGDPVEHKCLKHDYIFSEIPRQVFHFLRHRKRASFACPYCKDDSVLDALAHSSKSRWSKHKTRKLGNRKVKLQGYEHYALEYLLDIGRLPENLVASCEHLVPVVSYQYKGQTRKHYPDFFDTRRNELIEVKSIWTLGLNDPNLFYQLKQKRKGAIKLGYKYQVYVFNHKGKILYLPTNWFNLNHKQFFTNFQR